MSTRPWRSNEENGVLLLGETSGAGLSIDILHSLILHSEANIPIAPPKHNGEGAGDNQPIPSSNLGFDPALVVALAALLGEGTGAEQSGNHASSLNSNVDGHKRGHVMGGAGRSKAISPVVVAAMALLDSGCVHRVLAESAPGNGQIEEDERTSGRKQKGAIHTQLHTQEKGDQIHAKRESASGTQRLPALTCYIVQAGSVRSGKGDRRNSQRASSTGHASPTFYRTASEKAYLIYDHVHFCTCDEFWQSTGQRHQALGHKEKAICPHLLAARIACWLHNASPVRTTTLSREDFVDMLCSSTS